MNKSILLKYFAVLILIMCSCSKEKDYFELKEWLAEKKLMETKAVAFQSDCDSLVNLLKNLQNEEFKAKTFLTLAKCYVQKGDEKKAEKYLKRYISAGNHISWIDTTYFSSILPSEKEYEELNENFWKKKDTFYFSEIEKQVQLDQALVQNNEVRKKIFKRNSKYLLKITDSIGFPWSPGPSYFNKERFRVGVKPDLIAIHAPVEEKIIHQENAIEAARKGEISWNTPIAIGVTFFTQRPRKNVMPIRFLQFDEHNRLKIKKSYPQLYSIKKYFQDLGFSSIKFQPSIKNDMEKDIILQQLQDIKKVMVEEFGWPENAIEISSDPDTAETFKEDQQEGSYPYTFTVF